MLPDEPIVPTVPTPQPQQLSIDQAMQLASQHQQEGRLQDAEHLLKQILAAQPKHAHALHLLGIVAHMAGKGDLAIQLIKQAIDSDKTVALFHSNIAEMYRLQGQLSNAIQHGQKAVKLDTNMVSAHSNLGIAYYDHKDFEAARKCQEKALQLDPNFVQSLNNMGSILRQDKNFEGAAEFYRKAIAINAHYLEPLNNIGAVLVRMDQYREALEHVDKALTMNPNYADAHCNKGFAHLGLDEEGQAQICFMQALALKPDYPEAHIGLARLKKEQNEMEEAETHIRTAIDQAPDMAEAYSVLGAVLTAMGDENNAQKAYDKALSLDENLTSAKLGIGQIFIQRGALPEAEEIFRKVFESGEDRISALFSLIQAVKVKPGDALIEAMKTEAKQLSSLPESKQISVHFALGKMHGDLKEYDTSFEHYMQGCRLKRTKIDFDIEHHERLFEAVCNICSKERLQEMAGQGCRSETPIFIVGMPRSGTTLTEQIIASHPDVSGAGELYEFQHVIGMSGKDSHPDFPGNLEGLKPEEFKALGQDYVERIQQYSEKSKHIIDKMPINFVNVGLIHMALPNAKIVHVQRNPLDTCISCFTHLFAHNQNQTYDLYELGQFYRVYKKQMDYWRETLPEGAFLDFSYEELTDNPEERSKALIAYCGLKWDEACLDFHNTKRTVRTASVTQVRQPIYKSSVARWKRYEKFLEPLIDGLGDAYQG